MSKKELPPPGELIDVGGFRLHMQRRGRGSPTVVLESGLFANSLTWCLVQPAIARRTQVISYDRAGTGWSDPSPNVERSARFVIRELKALLAAAGIDGPVVLVGWSSGGLYVRKFAYAYPEMAAGMVLVDSAHESFMSRYPTDIAAAFEQGFFRANADEFQAFAQKTHEQLLKEFQPSAVWGLFPRKIQKLFLDRRRPHAFETLARVASYTEDYYQDHDALKPLGAMPLVVLSANFELAPYLTDEQNATMAKVERELQIELAALSSNCRHSWVDCGHAIQIENPQAVIDAVLEVVMKVRDQTS